MTTRANKAQVEPIRSASLVDMLQAGGVAAARASARNVFGAPVAPWKARIAYGEGLRKKTPVSDHGGWTPSKDRPDPVSIVTAANAGRIPELIPVRMYRMAASPFAFLRGSAAVMAWDLAHAPSCGVNVVIGGDAHISNFGLFGDPRGEVVIDINDFDEVTIAPWEWDLKRLAASIEVAGRGEDLKPKARRRAVMAAVAGYRWNLGRLRDKPIIDLWRQYSLADRLGEMARPLDSASAKALKSAVKAAKAANNLAALDKFAVRDAKGVWRLRPPVKPLKPTTTREREAVIAGLAAYSQTLAPDRQFMLRRYRVVAVERQVVGVGSVGMRVYLVLMMGAEKDDPLFLQVKEAGVPVHAPHVPALPEDYAHEGRRVVFGQRMMQAFGDPLLGWTQIEGRPYYVRQLRDRKGSIPMETLAAKPFAFFAFAYGALLARAHARSGDAAAISGYCGEDDALDQALGDWAAAYADQTEADHAAFVAAIKSGQVKALAG